MDKETLIREIIAALTADLEVLVEAAKTAHAAATHEECIPDNKYDTTGLEASYIAQGQANRAQDIRQALDRYRKLNVSQFNDTTPIRLSAVVIIESDDGSCRRVFLGPDAGGLKLNVDGNEYVVITPESPLGRALLGKVCDDEVVVNKGAEQKSYVVLEVF